jgi:hypothetical protein
LTDLSLYGLDRDGLVPVLKGLVTDAANTGRQMPCGHIGQRIERRLTIGPSRHNGLADLLLDETQTDERTVPEDDRPDLCDAIEETSRSGEKASLVFDGSRYDVPKTLQFSGRGTAMWDWLGFD